MYTVQKEFAGTKIPKWSPWPTSNAFVHQCEVASDLCFSFCAEEAPRRTSPPTLSSLQKIMML